jgi:plastocyanin
MRKHGFKLSGSATPWIVFLISLLLLIGLTAGGCRQGEKTEETPSATATATSEATPPVTTEATPPAMSEATPPAATTITIEGVLPPKWVWKPSEMPVGKGDTIIWKSVSGTHGVSIPSCATLKDKMDFDPPLDANCKTKNVPSQPGGALILTATVKDALDADVPFVCTVHGSMKGTIKKK